MQKISLRLSIGVLLVAGLGIYGLKLVVSDSLDDSRYSLAYIVLTPAEIKAIPTNHDAEVVHFFYSAADGNKPVIHAMEIVVNTDPQAFLTKLTKHMEKAGFVGMKNARFSIDKSRKFKSIPARECQKRSRSPYPSKYRNRKQA